MTGDRVRVTHLQRPWRWLARCALVVLVLWCAGYAVWDAHDRAVWRARGVVTTAVLAVPEWTWRRERRALRAAS